MQAIEKETMFAELTEEEAATLNGGRICVRVRVRRCVRVWWGIWCRWLFVIRCY